MPSEIDKAREALNACKAACDRVIDQNDGHVAAGIDWHALRSSIERGLASLPAQAVPAGWLPIESAPKDGTKIIVADIGGGHVYDVVNGYFEVLAEDEEDGPWSLDGGEPHCSYVGRAEGTYFCSWLYGKELDQRWRVSDKFPYTHWMPLPAAPQAPSGGEPHHG